MWFIGQDNQGCLFPPHNFLSIHDDEARRGALDSAPRQVISHLMLLLADSGGVDGSSLIEMNFIHPLSDEASAIGVVGIVDPQARRHKGAAGDEPVGVLLHSADITEKNPSNTEAHPPRIGLQRPQSW